MTPDRWQQIKDLYAAAKTRPVDDRAAYVRSSGADGAVVSDVLALLSAHDHAAEFLEPLAPSMPDEPTPRPDALLGQMIGAFRLVRVLGVGGMGTVYEAEQAEPRRRVALKLIRRPEGSDAHVVKLFRRETQALAMLNHPHIAGLYEAGQADDGRPYFAMELVLGVPLTHYSRDRSLPPRDRLDLFARVCDGIAYAHQRGVIHRDIKPSNILVDATGRPRILDFGLARITDSDVTLTTLTRDLVRIQGTLAYMSPEQARGKSDDIDLRSDIYSLGVLLFELLTGKRPYDIRQAPLPHAVRLICEESPRKPSTVLRALRGDLETIVLKALEKAPERRYQSAADLGRDVRHFLASEPIEARRDSAWYLARKLAGRHRLAVATAAAFVLLLAGSSVVAWNLYLRAGRAADEAVAAREAADEVTLFLHDTLAAAHPSISKRPAITMKEVLDSAAAKLDGAFPGQPAVEAKLRRTIAAAYRGLGQHDDAARQFGRGIELLRGLGTPSERELASCLNLLGRVDAERRHFDIAEAGQREALDRYSRLLGPDDPNCAAVMCDLADIMRLTGRFDEAEPLADNALAIFSRQGDRGRLECSIALNVLGLVAHHRGRLDEAEVHFRRAREIRRAELPADHPDIAEVADNLGLALQELSRFDEGVAMRQEAHDIRTRSLGPDHPVVAVSAVNLAQSLRRLGRLDEAETLARGAVEGLRKAWGEDHPDVFKAESLLAGVLGARGTFDEAEAIYLRHIDDARRAGQPRDLGETLNNYGAMCLAAGKFGAAARAYEESVGAFRAALGERHLHVGVASLGLGKALARLDRATEAEAALATALGILETSPPNAWRALEARIELGKCLTRVERFEDAEGHLLKAVELAGTTPKRADKPIDDPAARLAELYEAWGQPERAAAWRAKQATSRPGEARRAAGGEGGRGQG